MASPSPRTSPEAEREPMLGSTGREAGPPRRKLPTENFTPSASRPHAHTARRNNRLFLATIPRPGRATMRPAAPIARVVFPSGPQQPFDYEVPEVLRSAAVAGRRVRAPLGRGDRSALGLLRGNPPGRSASGGSSRSGRGLRQTLLTPAMLRLTEWMADYYLCAGDKCSRPCCRPACAARPARGSVLFAGFRRLSARRPL